MNGTEFNPELFVLLAAVVGIVIFILDGWRRKVPAGLIVVGTLALVCGLMNFALAGLHAGAVIGRALRGRGTGGAEVFTYDFRFYSLVLLGVVIAIPGFLCLVSARGITKGSAQAWKKAVWSSVALLAVNVPLMPLQGFAVGLACIALVNLIGLTASRKRFQSVAGEPAPIPSSDPD